MSRYYYTDFWGHKIGQPQAEEKSDFWRQLYEYELERKRRAELSEDLMRSSYRKGPRISVEDY